MWLVMESHWPVPGEVALRFPALYQTWALCGWGTWKVGLLRADLQVRASAFLVMSPAWGVCNAPDWIQGTT